MSRFHQPIIRSHQNSALCFNQSGLQTPGKMTFAQNALAFRSDWNGFSCIKSDRIWPCFMPGKLSIQVFNNHSNIMQYMICVYLIYSNPWPAWRWVVNVSVYPSMYITCACASRRVGGFTAAVNPSETLVNRQKQVSDSWALCDAALQKSEMWQALLITCDKKMWRHVIKRDKSW